MKVLITGDSADRCLDWALLHLKRRDGVATAIGLDGILDQDKFLTGYQAYLLTPDEPTVELMRLQGANETDIKTARSFYIAGLGGLLYSALNANTLTGFDKPLSLEFVGLMDETKQAVDDFVLAASK